MRRVLIGWAFVALVALVAVPAQASTQKPAAAADRHLSPAQVQAGIAAMKTAGWSNIRFISPTSYADTLTAADIPAHAQTQPEQVSTAAAPQPDTWHIDGRFDGTYGWYNPANGRFYQVRGVIDVQHSADEGNVYRPVVTLYCERMYGNLTVSNYCNLNLGTFRVQGFASQSDTTPTVLGQAEVADLTCGTSTAYWGASWRYAYDGLNLPYKMGFQAYVLARWWRNSDCNDSIYLQANPRGVGTYRVNLGTENIDYDNNYTGWHYV